MRCVTMNWAPFPVSGDMRRGWMCPEQYQHSYFCLLIFVFLIPFETAFLALGHGAPSVSRLLGMYTFLAWVVAACKRDSRMILPGALKLAIAFGAWAALSLLWAWDREAAIPDLATAVQLLMLSFLVVNICRSRERLKGVLWALFAGCLAVSILGLMGIGTEVQKYGATTLRDQGAKEFGSYAGIAFLFGGLSAAFGPTRTKVLATIVALAACVPVLASGERGVILALALAWSAIILVHRRKAMSVLSFSVAGALVCLLLVVLEATGRISSDVKNRFTVSQVVETGGSGRTDIWKVGLSLVRDNLWLGTGLKNFRSAVGFYATGIQTKTVVSAGRDPHSDYLDVLSGLGIPGFTLFIAVLLSAASGVVRTLRHFDHTQEQTLSLSVWGLFIYVLSIGLASTYMWRKVYWLSLGVTMAWPVAFRSGFDGAPMHKAAAGMLARPPESRARGVLVPRRLRGRRGLWRYRARMPNGPWFSTHGPRAQRKRLRC